MKSLSVRVRGALQTEIKKVCDFYVSTESPTLPPPSLQTIAKALATGSLLVVENSADGSFVATAGYFEYIKSSNRRLIFELAGTRVTSAIGRLNPHPFQQILLALRFFQIASTEDESSKALSVISTRIVNPIYSP